MIDLQVSRWRGDTNRPPAGLLQALSGKGQALLVMSFNCLHLRQFLQSANSAGSDARSAGSPRLHKFCATGPFPKSKCLFVKIFPDETNFHKKCPDDSHPGSIRKADNLKPSIQRFRPVIWSSRILYWFESLLANCSRHFSNSRFVALTPSYSSKPPPSYSTPM